MSYPTHSELDLSKIASNLTSHSSPDSTSSIAYLTKLNPAPSYSSMDMGSESSSSSTSSSSHEHPAASRARAPPKRPAGRTKFKETRHPVYRGVRRRGSSGRWVCEVRVPGGKRGERLWSYN